MMKSSQHDGRLKSEYNRNAEDKDVRRVKLMTNYNVCKTTATSGKRHSQNEPLQYSQFDKLTTAMTIMTYQLQ